MKVKVIIHAANERGYWAEVPALPGVVSEGESLEEIRFNIREAAEGWIEAGNDRQPGEACPADLTEEIDL